MLVPGDRPWSSAGLSTGGIASPATRRGNLPTNPPPPSPTQSAVRVWDALFLEGPKVLFRVAVSLLKASEPTLLLQDNPGELLRAVRRCAGEVHDRDALMRLAFDGVGSMPMERIRQFREHNQREVDSEFAARETRLKLRQAQRDGFVLQEHGERGVGGGGGAEVVDGMERVRLGWWVGWVGVIHVPSSHQPWDWKPALKNNPSGTNAPSPSPRRPPCCRAAMAADLWQQRRRGKCQRFPKTHHICHLALPLQGWVVAGMGHAPHGLQACLHSPGLAPLLSAHPQSPPHPPTRSLGFGPAAALSATVDRVKHRRTASSQASSSEKPLRVSSSGSMVNSPPAGDALVQASTPTGDGMSPLQAGAAEWKSGMHRFDSSSLLQSASGSPQQVGVTPVDAVVEGMGAVTPVDAVVEGMGAVTPVDAVVEGMGAVQLQKPSQPSGEGGGVLVEAEAEATETVVVMVEPVVETETAESAAVQQAEQEEGVPAMHKAEGSGGCG
jgi:hypothetical protein